MIFYYNCRRRFLEMRFSMARGKKPRIARFSIVLALAFTAVVILNNVGKESMDGNDEMRNPIIIGFPLKGEWLSPNTPGTKIPSHGTNRLGTRYAYDFIQVDWERMGWPAYRVSLPHYLIFGVPNKHQSPFLA